MNWLSFLCSKSGPKYNRNHFQVWSGNCSQTLSHGPVLGHPRASRRSLHPDRGRVLCWDQGSGFQLGDTWGWSSLLPNNICKMHTFGFAGVSTPKIFAKFTFGILQVFRLAAELANPPPPPAPPLSPSLSRLLLFFLVSSPYAFLKSLLLILHSRNRCYWLTFQSGQWNPKQAREFPVTWIKARGAELQVSSNNHNTETTTTTKFQVSAGLQQFNTSMWGRSWRRWRRRSGQSDNSWARTSTLSPLSPYLPCQTIKSTAQLPSATTAY